MIQLRTCVNCKHFMDTAISVLHGHCKRLQTRTELARAGECGKNANLFETNILPTDCGDAAVYDEKQEKTHTSHDTIERKLKTTVAHTDTIGYSYNLKEDK
jgi:hypothetical protein